MGELLFCVWQIKPTTQQQDKQMGRLCREHLQCTFRGSFIPEWFEGSLWCSPVLRKGRYNLCVFVSRPLRGKQCWGGSNEAVPWVPGVYTEPRSPSSHPPYIVPSLYIVDWLRLSCPPPPKSPFPEPCLAACHRVVKAKQKAPTILGSLTATSSTVWGGGGIFCFGTRRLGIVPECDPSSQAPWRPHSAKLHSGRRKDPMSTTVGIYIHPTWGSGNKGRMKKRSTIMAESLSGGSRVSYVPNDSQKAADWAQ